MRCASIQWRPAATATHDNMTSSDAAQRRLHYTGTRMRMWARQQKRHTVKYNFEQLRIICLPIATMSFEWPYKANVWQQLYDAKYTIKENVVGPLYFVLAVSDIRTSIRYTKVPETLTSIWYTNKYSTQEQVLDTRTSTRRRRKSVTATHSRFLQPNTTEHVAENLNEKKNC